MPKIKQENGKIVKRGSGRTRLSFYSGSKSLAQVLGQNVRSLTSLLLHISHQFKNSFLP